MNPTPIFYRRNLPHWQPANTVLFVTFRLADSLPQHVLALLREERLRLMREKARNGETEEDKRIRMNKVLFGLMDKALGEQSCGPHWLSDARIARIVVQEIKVWENVRYFLLRYTIMPNHVHLLIEPMLQAQDAIEDEGTVRIIPCQSF